MIKVYILLVQRIDNTDAVVGIEHIHHAFLTYGAGKATLVQDTTPEEDTALSALAIEVRDPTPEEIAALEALPEPMPPTEDELRVRKLLATSPAVITQPEIWELLRIFGRKLGY
uniref:Uncharacterized protein n=1 Tax=viral metagenome TaxID=1070528 RepID=A0A6H1ZSM1_9ZZZZ